MKMRLRSASIHIITQPAAVPQ